MKLIVGLGNIGEKYAAHRHNVGFMALNMFAEAHVFPKPQAKFHGVFSKKDDMVLLWPHTFMNESGRAVQAAATFFKITPENIYVLHDELDLPFGALKTKLGGGEAGHNGLKSISGALGKNYHRVRIGIDHPGERELVSPYVLSNFSKPEQKELGNILNEVVTLTTHLITKKE